MALYYLTSPAGLVNFEIEMKGRKVMRNTNNNKVTHTTCQWLILLAEPPSPDIIILFMWLGVSGAPDDVKTSCTMLTIGEIWWRHWWMKFLRAMSCADSRMGAGPIDEAVL